MTTQQSLFLYADGSVLRAGSVKMLLKYNIWEGNRVLDTKHVDYLESTITEPRHIQGPFSIAEWTDTETGAKQRRIIDGQHRHAVLKRYFSKNPAAEDFPVLARIYMVTNYEDIIQVFRQINNAKPMIYKDSPVEQLHILVSALRKAFVGVRGKTTVSLIRPGTNRPYLDTVLLESALKLYRINENPAITATSLVEHAEKMNGWLAEDHRRISGLPTRNTLDKAIELGFFLGLDPQCSWLIPLSVVN